MKFIEEIVVEEFLPTFRSMLAEALREEGFTQHQVADALGISQSAVSKYTHGDVSLNPSVQADERVQGLVERVTRGLASEEMTRVQALIEAEVLIRQLERGDLLAQLHEQAMPALAGRSGEFSVHDPDSELHSAQRVLASIRRGLRVLENTRGVTSLIPNVGSNLVEAIDAARSIDDVAAVPGRLFGVKDALAVPSSPEFGASEHLASVLLAARAAGSDARAAINIRYDEALLDGLAATGPAARFDPTADLTEAVRDALDETPDASVLYHTGGFGIEPIIYVLAPDAETAAERVRSLARDDGA